MQRQLPLLAVVSTNSEGSDLPGREENFPQIFGRVARVVWPRKTAFILAQIGGASDRAAKDWLSGKVAPPAVVITAIMVEITKRA